MLFPIWSGHKMTLDQTDAMLAELGTIPSDYVHHDRWVQPREPLHLPGAISKWYDVGRPGRDIPPELASEGRAFLQAEAAAGRVVFGHGLGWVVLHDCTGVTFLILGIWNGVNECWHVAYARNPDAPELGYRIVETTGTPKPMLCVWEMTPVWHERNAWSRYLYSARDSAAKRAFLSDQITGAA